MSCEFSQPSLDGRSPACRKIVALKEIIDRNGLNGVFTVSDLMKDICNNTDSQAQDQCHAHADLTANGRASIYCK